MWVKTQDGKQLLDINRFAVTKYNSSDVVEISGFTTGVSTYIDLGSYSTEERAMRVLNDIESALNEYKSTYHNNKTIHVGIDRVVEHTFPVLAVFTMPKKDY